MGFRAIQFAAVWRKTFHKVVVMFGILALACGIVSFVCWIIVLVKIFQAGEVGLGIVGIICGIFAFIYGWVKVDEYNIRQVMLIWTAAAIGGIAIRMLFMSTTVVVTH
jgi:hypothetical protein